MQCNWFDLKLAQDKRLVSWQTLSKAIILNESTQIAWSKWSEELSVRLKKFCAKEWRLYYEKFLELCSNEIPQHEESRRNQMTQREENSLQDSSQDDDISSKLVRLVPRIDQRFQSTTRRGAKRSSLKAIGRHSYSSCPVRRK